MTWETQHWAARQRPGSASAKLVLLGLASCADSNHCAYPSVQWLCDFSDLNRKTIISALDRLEEAGLIADTGDRRGRTMQVKVYRLAAVQAAGATSDPRSATVPKAEPSRNRNSSGSSSKESRKRDTEPFREPKPPSSPSGDEAPAADLFGDEGKGEAEPEPKATKPHRLPDGWTAPAIDDLPPKARELVRQWPPGAFDAVCEAFRLHWLSETRAIGRKSDWTAAFGKWLINDHPQVMRAAKAGVSFGSSSASKPAAPPRPAGPVAAKAREDDRSARLHAALRKKLGDVLYSTWLKPVALIFDPPGLVAVFPSEFARQWAEDRFQSEIRALADMVNGGAVQWVRFEAEAPTRQREGKVDHG